jgi:hypothetical protein
MIGGVGPERERCHLANVSGRPRDGMRLFVERPG